MTQTETEREAPEPVVEESEPEARTNERSQIPFPYSDLKAAEAVARAVHQWGGRDVSQDQIAATLNTTTKSSGFRTDVAAARTFGLIEGRGTLSLAPLGHRLVDAETAAQARVEAFKNVPLFDAMFQEHRGKLLPGHKGVEAEMLRLGVPQKQATRARQIFTRSAQHAGFFDHSADRLVEPLTSGGSGSKDGNGDGDERTTLSTQGNLPPEVQLLIEQLLVEGEGWPMEAQMAYVDSARNVLKARRSLTKHSPAASQPLDLKARAVPQSRPHPSSVPRPSIQKVEDAGH